MSGSTIEEGQYIQNGQAAAFSVTEATPFAPGQLGKTCNIEGNTQGVDSGLIPKQIRYVKRYATDTVARVAGDVAFWQDPVNFVITGEFASAVGATTAPLLAGVFGSAFPTAGSFGYIQVGGIGPVRLSDSTSSSTVGVPLVWASNNQVKQVGTTNSNAQVLGVGLALTTVTGTNVSVSAIISCARLAW